MTRDGEVRSAMFARGRRWLRRRRGGQDVATAPQAIPAPSTQDLVQEQAREVTFRIRNRSGLGVGAGAGFAIGAQLIVTNRHVVEGADPLEVSTWDGRVLEVDVADVAGTHDLAVLRTVRTLQGVVDLAERPACPGDLVYVVGYPLGGPFAAIRGLVVDQVEGSALGGEAHVLRVKAVVLPGYSGGPILNFDGEVVGVVFALGRATRYALAIPVSSLKGWLESASLNQVRRDEDPREEPRDTAGA